MITVADEYRICKKGRGLSTDQKPMDWDNGSFFYEMDTAQAVSDYLDEHLTNPTNPPIDMSLAIAGAAADTKATGDIVNELKNGLSALSARFEALGV